MGRKVSILGLLFLVGTSGLIGVVIERRLNRVENGAEVWSQRIGGADLEALLKIRKIPLNKNFFVFQLDHDDAIYSCEVGLPNGLKTSSSYRWESFNPRNFGATFRRSDETGQRDAAFRLDEMSIVCRISSTGKVEWSQN